jgi:hypothetical protein
MRKNGSQHNLAFPPEDYDDQYCLKAGFFLKLIFIILMRSFFFVLMIYSPFVRENAHLFTRGIENLSLYVSYSVPSSLVVLVYLRRGPDSGCISRFIWRYGALFLLLSATGYLLMEFNPRPALETTFLFTALDLLCCAYLLISRRARAVFKEFPMATPP